MSITLTGYFETSYIIFMQIASKNKEDIPNSRLKFKYFTSQDNL
jgi:hypothetical protein